MRTQGVILTGPENVALGDLRISDPAEGDIVVEIEHSGISTGTEKLFWSGKMPPFPGMGYPLVPGYEAVGRVVEARPGAIHRVDDWVFVPGSTCFEDAYGLFGGSARRLTVPGNRTTRVEPALGADAVLLALAATARHALAGLHNALPELIVGHGTLGRLLARLTVAAGARPPVVWEIDPARRDGADGYTVVDPADDERRDYKAIYDASGNAALLNDLIGRLAKGGEIVLAGFYADDLRFAFPPAFMKEARLRIAAEWTPDDMRATRDLVEAGVLSLDGLVTHRRPAEDVAEAYPAAFDDPGCLKMILDWKDVA